MRTLEDILESLCGDETLALNDGATLWYAETLLDTMRREEDPDLEKEVEVYKFGIHVKKGFSDNNWNDYYFEKGIWNDDGEFEKSE
jgi:hypothetical protein